MSLLKADQVVKMIQRSLNLVDKRLVDHGIRVAMIIDAMLKVEGNTDLEVRKKLFILALLHDIGAYRTEEIDRLVTFETDNVWDHSIYGYLFLREFTHLKEFSKVILYHHAKYGKFTDEPEDIVYYANMFHVADRADIFMEYVVDLNDNSKHNLKRLFKNNSKNSYNPKAVELFWKAEKKYNLLSRLKGRIEIDDIFDCSSISDDEAKDYLNMLVHVIDFRSHHTVTHTVNTIQISCQLAARMGLSSDSIEQIYYGALMHDFGKIGIPLSILEKPDKLTDDEMKIMRTHVEITEEIIRGCAQESVIEIAVRHHEKLNGRGYPRRLSAKDLSIEERIVAVSDIVSALCKTRSYKEAFPKEKVIAILENMSDTDEIDSSIVHIVKTQFDDIMEQVKTQSEPVMKIYGLIASERRSLSEKLGEN